MGTVILTVTSREVGSCPGGTFNPLSKLIAIPFVSVVFSCIYVSTADGLKDVVFGRAARDCDCEGVCSARDG